MSLKDDIAALVDNLEDSPDPFGQAFRSLSDLARRLRLATGIPFTCKVGPNFSIELWVGSSFRPSSLLDLDNYVQGYRDLANQPRWESSDFR